MSDKKKKPIITVYNDLFYDNFGQFIPTYCPVFTVINIVTVVTLKTNACAKFFISIYLKYILYIVEVAY